MFAGNVVEGTTLAGMLAGLGAPTSALVIMDRGIATEENIAWLVAHHYRYLVVSRERARHFDADAAVATTSACGQTIRLQRVVNADATEARLYCHSEERQEKEMAIAQRFVDRRRPGQTAHHQGSGQAAAAHRSPDRHIPWHRSALSH
jgi:hypothetical protein